MENNKLKTLINQATTGDNYYQSTVTTPISQEELDKIAKAPIKLEPAVSPQQGWQCPVCGAVMSPWTSTCINCHGNWNYSVTWKYNPYEVTCKTGSDSNSYKSNT